LNESFEQVGHTLDLKVVGEGKKGTFENYVSFIP